MNKITLSFKDPEFERKYKISQHSIEFNILKTNFKYICLLSLIPIINNLILRNYLYAIIVSIIFFGILVVRFIGSKSIILFDYVCFFNLILFNLSLPFSLYFQQATNEHLQMYFIGQSASYCLFSFLLGTQFILKALVCSINCFSQLTLIWLKDGNFTSLARYFFLIYTITVINTLYLQEKEKRLRFQLQCSKSQFDELIFQQINVGVIQCKYLPQMDKIQMMKANQVADNKFNIKNNETFKIFLRNIHFLSQISSISKSVIQGKKYNLEHFIYRKFQQSAKKKSKKSIYETQYKFRCIYEINQYILNVSFFYNNEPQCMIMIENDNDILNQIERQQIKLIKLLFSTLIIKQEKLVENCLFSMKNILMQQKSAKNMCLQFNCHIIQMWIQLMINNFQNSKLYLFGIQGLIKIERVILKNLIEDIVNIYQPFMKLKKIKCEIYFQNDYELFTSKDLLRQLINNILANCVFNCKEKTKIEIEINKKNIVELNTNIIQIKFIDKNEELTPQIINSLPILNPYHVDNFERIFQQKRVRNKMYYQIVKIRIDNIFNDIKNNRCIRLNINLLKCFSKNCYLRDNLRFITFKLFYFEFSQRYYAQNNYLTKQTLIFLLHKLVFIFVLKEIPIFKQIKIYQLKKKII